MLTVVRKIELAQPAEDQLEVTSPADDTGVVNSLKNINPLSTQSPENIVALPLDLPVFEAVGSPTEMPIAITVASSDDKEENLLEEYQTLLALWISEPQNEAIQKNLYDTITQLIKKKIDVIDICSALVLSYFEKSEITPALITSIIAQIEVMESCAPLHPYAAIVLVLTLENNLFNSSLIQALAQKSIHSFKLLIFAEGDRWRAPQPYINAIELAVTIFDQYPHVYRTLMQASGEIPQFLQASQERAWITAILLKKKILLDELLQEEIDIQRCHQIDYVEYPEDFQSMNVLMAAAAHNLELFKILLPRADELQTKNKQGYTVLHFALKRFQFAAATLILNKEPNLKLDQHNPGVSLIKFLAEIRSNTAAEIQSLQIKKSQQIEVNSDQQPESLSLEEERHLKSLKRKQKEIVLFLFRLQNARILN